jgi:hypothetical protein
VACGSFLDERIGLKVAKNEKQAIFWRRERTVLVHREPAGGSGFPIEAPSYKMRLERGLKRYDELLKLLARQASQIQEF